MLVATFAILPAGLDRMVFPGGALSSLGLPVGISTFVALKARRHSSWRAGSTTSRRAAASIRRSCGAEQWCWSKRRLRSVIGRTAAWQAFAGWLVS
jgi:hypothetical protein